MHKQAPDHRRAQRAEPSVVSDLPLRRSQRQHAPLSSAIRPISAGNANCGIERHAGAPPRRERDMLPIWPTITFSMVRPIRVIVLCQASATMSHHYTSVTQHCDMSLLVELAQNKQSSSAGAQNKAQAVLIRNHAVIIRGLCGIFSDNISTEMHGTHKKKAHLSQHDVLNANCSREEQYTHVPEVLTQLCAIRPSASSIRPIAVLLRPLQPHRHIPLAFMHKYHRSAALAAPQVASALRKRSRPCLTDQSALKTSKRNLKESRPALPRHADSWGFRHISQIREFGQGCKSPEGPRPKASTQRSLH
eukprot:4063154-Pleurochrysis_carterae.AAC.2